MLRAQGGAIGKQTPPHIAAPSRRASTGRLEGGDSPVIRGEGRSVGLPFAGTKASNPALPACLPALPVHYLGTISTPVVLMYSTLQAPGPGWVQPWTVETVVWAIWPLGVLGADKGCKGEGNKLHPTKWYA